MNKRRAGSESSGVGCARVFGLIFFLAGLGFLILLVKGIWEEFEVGRSWVETNCTIVSKDIKRFSSSDGTTYRPEIVFKYEYDGRSYTATGFQRFKHSSSYKWAQKHSRRFTIGNTATCWVNPDKPMEAVVYHGIGWSWLFLLLPLLFIVIGLAIMVYTGKKLSRSRKMKGVEVFPDLKSKTRGRTLPIAIKPETKAFHKVITLLIFTLLWNGFVGFAVYQVWKDGPSFVLLFLSIFVIVGVVAVFVFIHRLFFWLFVGDAAVEIENEPLVPGQRVRVLVSHPARFKVQRATIKLICREEATYRQGTRSYTKKEVVHEEPLLDVLENDIGQSRPIKLNTEATIPPDAMHSFHSRNNKILWAFEVKMEIPGKPDVNECYVFRVADRQR